MTEEPEAQRKGQTRTETFLAQAMSTFGDAVYRLALSQTRLKADAEDVYQDVFLRLYNNETSFASNDHLKAWLLRVTINRCHDLARSSWKRRSVAFDPERDDVATPVRSEEDAAVWDAVGQLPEQLRAAVNLHYVEGYSTDEIASIMQCRPATARTWLFRARARMRELLQDKQDTTACMTHECPAHAPDKTSIKPDGSTKNRVCLPRTKATSTTVAPWKGNLS